MAATAATCPRARWTNYGPALHPPIGPLHWAGAEYAHVWNGYMDGAVRSGEATAAEVVQRPVAGYQASDSWDNEA